MIDWLKDRYSLGTTLAGICTGSFLLAETGLLDGKEATTHWSAADRFKARYPQIRLKSDKLVINHDDLFCAEGAGSSADLAYHLLEKYMGYALAAKTAKYFTHDFERAPERISMNHHGQTRHGDAKILQTQRWIHRHLSDPITIAKLSQLACMSYRTFERRFKCATGDSPLIYIQRMRVEAAKRKLATTNLSFDEISYQTGYQNSASFRKIFVKWVNLLPSEYRNRFKTYM
jgi:transcriptional regulator GlxA family with amidase domain